MRVHVRACLSMCICPFVHVIAHVLLLSRRQKTCKDPSFPSAAVAIFTVKSPRAVKRVSFPPPAFPFSAACPATDGRDQSCIVNLRPLSHHVLFRCFRHFIQSMHSIHRRILYLNSVHYTSSEAQYKFSTDVCVWFGALRMDG